MAPTHGRARDVPRLPYSQELPRTPLVQGGGGHAGRHWRIRGIISTEDLFNKERMRMATHVWTEYKANDSRACRGCHAFSKDVLAKAAGNGAHESRAGARGQGDLHRLP
jgi:hypothetical protein